MATTTIKPLTGRRKEAVARVRLVAGTGESRVNGRSASDYLKRDSLVLLAMSPLKATNTADKFDVVAKINEPTAYLHMLGKKIGKLRKAAEQFRIDAAEASTHTNFQQAVISMDACVQQLQELLNAGRETPAQKTGS